tara:strand:- start:145 stop:732 length:588 start_codon:yes stop_codon:yes gene_type:complete
MPIKKEYQNYDYWCWKNYFNNKQVKNFNKLISKNIIYKENIKKGAFDSKKNSLKNVDTFIVNLSSVSEFIKPVLDSVRYINDKNFQYDLHNNFELHDTGNYNIYKSTKNSDYKWHNDSSNDIRFDLKFTVLINLSEKEYKGGEFQLFNTETYTINEFKNSGSVLMFKPFINHCVTPVTDGERKTFTIFVFGSKWK